MALIPRFAFFALFLLPYQCEAKAESCSKTECVLLPVGDDLVASEFRFKASEKGLRLVHIYLVIGNASYDPLELPDEFLPHRWIWANTALEPMLSLPEDYDMLSAGLLAYQVKSIDVKLKDQPSGCLAKLNSTCKNLAVGRMLLQNVTSSISGDILHKNTPVVCVAVINTTWTDVPSAQSMWYRCCYMHKEATGPATIRCDKRIDVGKWLEIVNKIFLFLSIFLALFAPALPLALPDYVFSLEDEVEKENRLAEQANRETTGYQCTTNPPTVGEQDNQRGTGGDRSNTQDVTASNINIYAIQEETGRNTSNLEGNSRDSRRVREFIPVDDSSPMNLSTLLRESVKKFPDIPLSFNIKLAVMCFCVCPFVVYVQIGLYYTLKKRYIDEMRKKHVQVGSLFNQQYNLLFIKSLSYDPNTVLFFATGTIILVIILLLFSRPKDFILEGNGECKLCSCISMKYSSLNLSSTAGRSLGDEIHRHLRILHHFVWYALLRYGNILASICDNLLLGRLREEMHQESRGRHILCVGLRFISFIVALPFIIVCGILCLLILIVVLIFLLFGLSPVIAVFLFVFTKSYHVIFNTSLEDNYGRIVAVYTLLCGWPYFLGLVAIGLLYCFFLIRISCLFVSIVVSYIIIGLALNVSTVTPFLAFLLVLTTNVYSCYIKIQGKYREVKKMISTRLQELQLNSNVPKDTIPAHMYWFVCDKVLPIQSEICRMLRNMVLVIAFLFLALSSIVFFGHKYDISALTTTISVFFTGSIPLLFSKVLTTNSNIIGWPKIEMEREIDKAITEYIKNSNLEAPSQQIADPQKKKKKKKKNCRSSSLIVSSM